METYFPRAKHSIVILEASRAVVSGNFTLMSAGYFLSPEGKKKFIISMLHVFFCNSFPSEILFCNVC